MARGYPKGYPVFLLRLYAEVSSDSQRSWQATLVQEASLPQSPLETMAQMRRSSALSCVAVRDPHLLGKREANHARAFQGGVLFA